MSRRNNQEKEPLVEATAIKAPAQGDITEVKKMLETFLTKQNKQAKIIEATSKELKALSRRKRERPDTARLRARVDPQRLDFSAPRTTRGNPEDLPPPPPPRRETDKSPERIMDISDEEEPAPTKRTRAEGAEGSRQEPRASDTQSASGSSKTEIVKDTSEYTNYSSEEWYKKEQERRAFKRSYVAELAAVKAQMDRVTSDLKRTQSQIHHGTGKAPAIAQQEMSLNTPTTIQDALHRAADFARTEEEVQATKGGKTKQLKEYLATPPILAKPVTGEPLFLYIDVSETPVSAVLAREERGEQKPIFYVSKTLIDAETRYPQLEKLALSVVMASRKLRPYFQSHTIIILSTFPLRSVLHSPSQSGGLAKWVVELSEYDIEYKGRTCNKSQVLVDFLIELPEDQTTKEVRPEIWELHVEGSSSKNGSGIGIRLASPTCEILEQSFRLGFRASNNEAEYEAIIARIRLAQGLNIKHVHALCDSQLLASQFSGEYAKAMAETRVKDVTMTEAKADTELTPLTMTPTTDADVIRVEVIEADVTDADVVRTEVPDDLGQPEDLSTQNLPLEPKDKDTTIPMDTNEEPEYGCDKSWIDQFALISLTESSLTASGQPARDKRPVKSWRKYTAGLVAITQEAKP
ncbi:hypothetical protein AALP_AA2G084100 [Arabis alpina]|nr:hypothetical protein AALP_AA2G084100 [Arabis alpina]